MANIFTFTSYLFALCRTFVACANLFFEINGTIVDCTGTFFKLQEEMLVDAIIIKS